MFADRQTATTDRDSSLAEGIWCPAAQIAIRVQPCSEKGYTGTRGILLLILGGFYRLPTAAVKIWQQKKKHHFLKYHCPGSSGAWCCLGAPHLDTISPAVFNYGSRSEGDIGKGGCKAGVIFQFKQNWFGKHRFGGFEL